VSLSPSFSRFLFCILSQAFSRTHAVARSFSCTHSHAHTGTRSLSPSFSHTQAHFSLFLPLSLSLSLFLTYKHGHAHTFALSHSLTCSLAHPLIHCCRVCALRCLQSAYARALSPLCISPPSFLSHYFPFRIYLFFSLPLLSLACLLAVFLSLVRFFSFSTPGSHDLI